MTNRELAVPLSRVRLRGDLEDLAKFAIYVREKGVVVPGGKEQKFRRVYSPSGVIDLLNPRDPAVYTLSTMNIPGEAGDRKYNDMVNKDNRKAAIVRRQVRDFIEDMSSEELM